MANTKKETLLDLKPSRNILMKFILNINLTFKNT